MKNPKTLFFVNIIAGTLIVLSGIHNLGLLDAEGFQGWGIPQIIAVIQIAFLLDRIQKIKQKVVTLK